MNTVVIIPFNDEMYRIELTRLGEIAKAVRYYDCRMSIGEEVNPKTLHRYIITQALATLKKIKRHD